MSKTEGLSSKLYILCAMLGLIYNFYNIYNEVLIRDVEIFSDI